ncbi:hypothetical protein ACH5RR_035542 [Cinchona calisaya]|uniref:Uncharacterized protein n=1 Tax=Cinchona calisaya TaxID=153742 RepID=A0ABD2Y627_9GENT
MVEPVGNSRTNGEKRRVEVEDDGFDLIRGLTCSKGNFDKVSGVEIRGDKTFSALKNGSEVFAGNERALIVMVRGKGWIRVWDGGSCRVYDMPNGTSVGIIGKDKDSVKGRILSFKENISKESKPEDQVSSGDQVNPVDKLWQERT